MIITIGRQHGSNGRDIARTLAAELNYSCYDKEILDTAAQNSSLNREIFDTYDEKKVSPFIVPDPHFIGMNEGFRLNMQIANAQFDAIRALAENGNTVFVGRCADYILRHREDLVRVFIRADLPFRVTTLMHRKGISEEDAKKLIREVDKDRSSYYKYYTDQIWGESEYYDLCVDSSRIGVQGSIRVIRSFIDALS